MARANPLLPAINAGEFSPKMRARVDFSRYPAGAETLLNCLIDERGGIYRRAGSYFANEVKDSSAETKLVNFVPNNDEPYVIEMGAGYLRFIRGQSQISVVSTSTAITNGTFAANITGWTDNSTGTGAIAWDGAILGGSMSLNSGGTGTTDIAWAEQSVTVAAGDQAKVHVLLFRVGDRINDFVYCRIGTSSGGTQLVNDRKCYNGWHAVSFTPGTGTIYVQFLTKFQGNEPAFIDDVSIHAAGALELTIPYTQGQIGDVRWAGTGDVMYFVHGDVTPYRLLRYGDRDWGFETVFFRDGPYLDPNTDSTITITAAATTGLSVNMTANRSWWKSTDVNRLLRIRFSNLWGYVLLHTYTSATVMAGTILRTLGGTTATSDFAMGAWCEELGYPSRVELFKQRSVYASSEKLPTTVWMSQAGDIENMMPDSEVGATPVSTIEDDDAVVYAVVEKQANKIVGLNAGRDLLVLTAGAEIPVSSQGPSITPTDVQASPQTTYGSNGTEPHAINSVTVFAQRGGRRILRLGFDIRIEGYSAEDLTILSEHITRSGVTKIAHAQEPTSVIWCVLGNGTLAAMTFHPEQQVAGWSRHVLGGKFNGRNAVVEDLITVPGTTTPGSNERDEVWMVVKRTINGSTKRYIEFLDKDYDLEDAVEDMVYADCALSVNYWNTDSGKTLTLGAAVDPDDDTLWEEDDTVTMAASGHTPFTSGDVGDVWLLRYKGEILVVEITAYSSSSSVTVRLTRDTPMNFRAASVDEWLDPDSKVSSVSGADHLEGETVVVLGDGAVQTEKTVSSGAITLDDSAGAVTIGLKYEHRYKSLKIEAGAILGTSMGKPKKIHDLTLEFFAATAFYIGPRFDDDPDEEGQVSMTLIPTREDTDPIGIRAKLWTKEYPLRDFPGLIDRDARICIKGDDPRPWFMLAAAPELITNEVI